MASTERERRALRVVCPVCKAGAGHPCLSRALPYSTEPSSLRMAIKHPHRERQVKGARTT